MTLTELLTWQEPAWFVWTLFALTIVGALYPVQMSPGRTFHYPVGYLAGLGLFFFGPRGVLFVMVAAGIGALIPYRFAFAMKPGLPIRLQREHFSEWRERAMGMVFEGAVALLAGMLAVHYVYRWLGPGTYPIPIGSTRAMLTFMALLATWGSAAVSALEVVLRLRGRDTHAVWPSDAQNWLASSEYTLYWIMLIVTGPLHVAHQAVYLFAGPEIALGVLVFLLHVNTLYNLSTYRRDHLQETLRQLESSQKLAAIGEVTARIAHTTRHQLGLIGIGTLKLEKLLQSLSESDAALLRAELQKLNDVRASLQEMLAAGLHGEELRDGEEEDPDETLGDLVTRQVGMLGAKAADRGIELRLDREAGGRAVRVQHPAAVAEGIFGVVENAVSLARAAVQVRYVTTPAGVTIEVLDDGPGMEPHVMARACEPFFTTRPEGTGMGLAIARGTIEREGGRLEIENRAGGGLRVAFVLPRVRGRRDSLPR